MEEAGDADVFVSGFFSSFDRVRLCVTYAPLAPRAVFAAALFRLHLLQSLPSFASPKVWLLMLRLCLCTVS